LRELFVADPMTRHVITVVADTPFKELTGTTIVHDFDTLPVIDLDGRLVGWVTPCAVHSDGRDSAGTHAAASLGEGFAMDDVVADERPKSSESDLQEYRAYLQRAETRLSTLHRVAGAFISGAGLLTLLPPQYSGCGNARPVDSASSHVRRHETRPHGRPATPLIDAV
jgi:hypothetical protein